MLFSDQSIMNHLLLFSKFSARKFKLKKLENFSYLLWHFWTFWRVFAASFLGDFWHFFRCLPWNAKTLRFVSIKSRIFSNGLRQGRGRRPARPGCPEAWTRTSSSCSDYPWFKTCKKMSNWILSHDFYVNFIFIRRKLWFLIRWKNRQTEGVPDQSIIF